MGYIRCKRSTGSCYAISIFIVPLRLINKKTIENFLEDYRINKYNASERDIEKLEKVKVAQWKYAAKKCGTNIWHHTGKDFRKTYHYDLYRAAEYILKQWKYFDISYELNKKFERKKLKRKKLKRKIR